MTLAQITQRLAADGLLKSAQVRADRGIAKASARVDADQPSWREWAATMTRWYARKHDRPFTMEMVRLWAYSHDLPVPVSERVWGAVTRQAVKDGVIRPNGGYARAASSNNSPKPLYVRVDRT